MDTSIKIVVIAVLMIISAQLANWLMEKLCENVSSEKLFLTGAGLCIIFEIICVCKKKGISENRDRQYTWKGGKV